VEHGRTKPPLRRNQSYQFGEQDRVYIEQLIFYEDALCYELAYMQHLLHKNIDDYQEYKANLKKKRISEVMRSSQKKSKARNSTAK
jgi:hypothetical protein